MSVSDEQLLQQFAMFDKDGNGELSTQEVTEMLTKSGFQKDFIKNFIKQFDADNDGTITLGEYKSKLDIIPANERNCSAWRKIFRKFDSDGSGKISAEELQRLFAEQNSKYDVETLRKWIKNRDADGDGELSYEEFLQFIGK